DVSNRVAFQLALDAAVVPPVCKAIGATQIAEGREVDVDSKIGAVHERRGAHAHGVVLGQRPLAGKRVPLLRLGGGQRGEAAAQARAEIRRDAKRTVVPGDEEDVLITDAVDHAIIATMDPMDESRIHCRASSHFRGRRSPPAAGTWRDWTLEMGG